MARYSTSTSSSGLTYVVFGSRTGGRTTGFKFRACGSDENLPASLEDAVAADLSTRGNKPTIVDGAMPQARRLILDSAFDADTVAMMGDVFDAAWGLIEAAFNGQPQSTIDDARTLLASNIVHQVKVGLSHPDILQEEAIRVVRQRYPSLRI